MGVWERVALVALIGCGGDDDGTGKVEDSSVTTPTSPTPTGETGDPEVEPRPLSSLFESGTRLEARSIGVAGASERRFSHFYDTQLEVPCAFVYATDEVLRCLPLADPLLAVDVYVDAVCRDTVEVYDCGDVAYALTSTPKMGEDACDPTIELNEVRAVEPVADPDGLFQVDPKLGCVALDAGPTAVAGRPGKVVDPTTFVGAMIRDLPGEEGFGVREVVADDGALLRQTVLTADGRSCAARYLADLGPRCVPDDVAVIGAGPGTSWWWNSGTCDDDPLAYVPKDACRTLPVELALQFEDEGAPRLWRVGASWGEPLAYDDRFGTCTATTVADLTWDLFSVAGPADAASLPALEVEVIEDEPVSWLWFATDAGLRVLPGFAEGRLGLAEGSSFQLASGDPCTAFPIAGGGAVCVDASFPLRDESSVRFYTDAGCTQELLAVPSGQPVPDAVVLLQSNVCGVATGPEDRVLVDVRGVGPADPGSELFLRSSQSEPCAPAERGPSLAYHPLTDSIVDDLPAMTVE